MALHPITEKKLYLESPMLSHGHKTIGDPPQQIYYEDYGNPKGELVFVLHGGPGYGTSSFYHRYFDPKHYHIVVFDQRNAHRSLPHAVEPGVIEHNTPWNMMEDINGLAESFGVDFDKGEKIHLMGGSWGSILQLYYGAHYPERLHSLTVRATTLAIQDELSNIHGLDENGEPRMKTEAGARWETACKPEWDKFYGLIQQHAPELAKTDPVAAYHFLLNDPSVDPRVRAQAAHRWVMLEHVVGDLVHTPEEVEADVIEMGEERRLNYATIENNWLTQIAKGTPGFFAQAGNPKFNFLFEGKNQHGENPLAALARVPLIRFVHGKKDDVCYLRDTLKVAEGIRQEMLKAGMTPDKIEQALKVVTPEESGHMIDDPGITTALVDASDEIRDIRKAELAINRTRRARTPG